MGNSSSQQGSALEWADIKGTWVAKNGWRIVLREEGEVEVQTASTRSGKWKTPAEVREGPDKFSVPWPDGTYKKLRYWPDKDELTTVNHVFKRLPDYEAELQECED
jgi:hypothetical protein